MFDVQVFRVTCSKKPVSKSTPVHGQSFIFDPDPDPDFDFDFDKMADGNPVPKQKRGDTSRHLPFIIQTIAVCRSGHQPVAAVWVLISTFSSRFS